MEPTTLHTERLLLRPLAAQDVDAVLAACQDPEITRWLPLPDPYRREDAEAFVLDHTVRNWRDDTAYNFGSFLTDGGGFVGTMALVRLDHLRPPERQAEIGYWTAPDRRGHGYTAEAARAVADWAFTELGAERLEWVAEVGNEASRGVALRVGFVMEGTQRGRIVHRGTRRDAWTATLLPSDWGRRTETPYLPAPRDA